MKKGFSGLAVAAAIGFAGLAIGIGIFASGYLQESNITFTVKDKERVVDKDGEGSRYLIWSEDETFENVDSLIENQRICEDMDTACSMAIMAGNDMSMNSPDFFETVVKLVKNGKTNVRIDYAVSGIGSNSCGPRIMEKYQINEKEIEFEFYIK